MAKFNLEDYETVEQRIQRFYRTFDSGRIETELTAFNGDIGKTRWVVYARVFRDSNPDTPPAGTGLAFEVDGSGMANNTSALENCETSAVGRALAQAGLSGSKRTTREEMAKVLIPELRERIANAKSKDDTRAVWNEANQNGVLNEVKASILEKAKEFDNE